MSSASFPGMPSIIRDISVDKIPRVLQRGEGPLHRSERDLPQRRADVAYAEADDAMLAELRGRAHSAGYEEGLRQGLAAAEQRFDAAQRDLQQRFDQMLDSTRRNLNHEHQHELQQLATLAGKIEASLSDNLKVVEQHAVVLAFTAIARILCPSSDRAIVLKELVQQHLANMKASSEAVVHLCQQDLQRVQSSHAGIGQLRWVADPALKPGDCVIKGPWGHVTVGLDEQLTRLRDVWLDILAHDESGSCASASASQVARMHAGS